MLIWLAPYYFIHLFFIAGECYLPQKVVPEEEPRRYLCRWNPQVSISGKKHMLYFKEAFRSRAMIVDSRVLGPLFHFCLVLCEPREDNIPWNSNVIVERVSTSMLKTVSGRVYILVGKMNVKLASGEFVNRILLWQRHFVILYLKNKKKQNKTISTCIMNLSLFFLQIFQSGF